MIQLHVHEVRQHASGGSSVVIYDAQVTLTEQVEVTVQIGEVVPEDTGSELVEAAQQAIRRGVEHVLRPRAQGALVSVHRLVVNPIDFKPSRFTLVTALELQRLLGVAGQVE